MIIHMHTHMSIRMSVFFVCGHDYTLRTIRTAVDLESKGRIGEGVGKKNTKIEKVQAP